MSTENTRAATVLRRGGAVASPTETVYGLGGAVALKRIFAVQR